MNLQRLITKAQSLAIRAIAWSIENALARDHQRDNKRPCPFCGHIHARERPANWPRVWPRYDICWDAAERN